MPFAKTQDGTEIYYESRGEGEPLLLIMGTGADHTAWAFQARFFTEAGYRVVTPDNRGVGQSRTPSAPEDYCVALLADDLVAVLETEGIEKAHVHGMSLGSAIAQEIALAHPERVASLGLHVTWGRTDKWLEYAFKSFVCLVEHADARAQAEVAMVWACSPGLIADDAAREQWLAMREASPHPPSKEGLLGQWGADLKHDTLERLPTISCPTLVTAGELDTLVPQRYGREVAEAIPGAKFHLFTGPRSSHVNCIEMPEEFNAASLEFLRGHRIS